MGRKWTAKIGHYRRQFVPMRDGIMRSAELACAVEVFDEDGRSVCEVAEIETDDLKILTGGAALLETCEGFLKEHRAYHDDDGQQYPEYLGDVVQDVSLLVEAMGGKTPDDHIDDDELDRAEAELAMDDEDEARAARLEERP